MGKHSFSLFFGLLSMLIIAPRLWVRMRQDLPIYDEDRPFFHLHNVWSQSDLDSLRSFIKSCVFKTMPRNTATRDSEVRLNPDSEGKCPYDYFVRVGDVCAPIGRLDALVNLARYGGIDGFKETVKDLMNTVHVFQLFQFGQELQRPELKRFMASKEFKEASAKVCGAKYPARKEVQVNINILLPGQQLPMHMDVPYFKDGGIVENFPLWLLAVMQGSGFWDSDIPPHVQGQAYFHLNDSIGGGGYFVYPRGPGAKRVTIEPVPNSAIVVDASRALHGVERILSGGRKAPPLFNQPGTVKYQSDNDVWEVTNDEGEILERYRTEELRITFIWRTLCFESEEERDSWNPKTLKYNAEEVLQLLEEDLKNRGVLGKEDPRPSPFEFALMLIDEYIEYPVDNLDRAWVPYNYCMLPYITTNEWLRSLLDQVVEFIC